MGLPTLVRNAALCPSQSAPRHFRPRPSAVQNNQPQEVGAVIPDLTQTPHPGTHLLGRVRPSHLSSPRPANPRLCSAQNNAPSTLTRSRRVENPPTSRLLNLQLRLLRPVSLFADALTPKSRVSLSSSVSGMPLAVVLLLAQSRPNQR